MKKFFIFKLIYSVVLLAITVIFAFNSYTSKGNVLLTILTIVLWVGYIVISVKTKDILNALGNMDDDELEDAFNNSSLSSYANISGNDEKDESFGDSNSNALEKEENPKNSKVSKKDEWDEILYGEKDK